MSVLNDFDIEALLYKTAYLDFHSKEGLRKIFTSIVNSRIADYIDVNSSNDEVKYRSINLANPLGFYSEHAVSAHSNLVIFYRTAINLVYWSEKTKTPWWRAPFSFSAGNEADLVSKQIKEDSIKTDEFKKLEAIIKGVAA